MTTIGGYSAYSQPLIQQRASQQQAPVEDDSSTKKSAATSREELFRSILKANETDIDNGISGREAVRSEASSGRGQFVDITV